MIGVNTGLNLSLVFQSETNECGLACLAMIRGYFGGDSDLQPLRRLSRLGHDGVTVKSLVALSEQVALSARAVQFELAEISQLRLPAILHWDGGHFVVMARVTRTFIVIFDPAAGVRKYQMAELNLHVSGVAIEFAPRPDFKPAEKRCRLSMKDVLKESGVETRALVTLGLMTAFIQTLALSTPLYVQLVVDQIISKSDLDLLAVSALCFTIFVSLRAALEHWRGLHALNLANRLGFDFLSGLAHHLFRLPLSFFERRKAGEILSRFESAENIKRFITGDLVSIFVDIIFSFAALILLYSYHTGIASAVLVAVAAVSAVHLVSVSMESPHREELLIKSACHQSRFMQKIAAVPTSKVFGITQKQTRHWEESYVDCLNAGHKLGTHQLRFGSLRSMILAYENVLVIYLGAVAVINQSMTLGQLMGLIFLKQHFISSIASLLPKLAEFRLLRLELHRLSDIANETPEREEAAGQLLHTDFSLDLKVAQLEYRYVDSRAPLLNGLTHTFTRGSVTALVGESGCGKSTFLRLLLKLLPLQQGSIQFGSRNLGDIPNACLRDNVSAVLHDDKLLPGDIAFNISLDYAEFNRQKLENLCRKLDILQLIENLPMGFGTQLGESETCFSAGQRQRLLIARALYRNPKILLLDEALANLSIDSAKQILAVLRASRITTLFVAHDAELIRCADSVVHLAQNSFISQGG